MSLVKYQDENCTQLVEIGRNSINDIVLYDYDNKEFQIFESSKLTSNETENIRHRGHRRKSDNSENSRAENININMNSKHDGNLNFRCKYCGKVNSFDDDNTSMNSSYLRPDYFQLLANSTKFLTNNEFYKTETIPNNVINQGYFEKFFKVNCLLGSGSYGKVYKVEHQLLNLNFGIFALKKIPIGNNLLNLKKNLNEVKFLCNLNTVSTCNNIIKYNHFWLEFNQISKFTPNIPVLFLLFEYCDGGTLEDWSHRLDRNLNNFEIFKIFSDITTGLNYLHNLEILHRDLKPSNCLFKTDFKSYKEIKSIKELKKIPTLVVSDFGESIMLNDLSFSSGNTGTLEFVAPEIIQNRKSINSESKFSYSSDIYSLGLILYYLCFKTLPFNEDLDPDNLSNEILQYNIDNISKIRNDLLENYIHLIIKMIDKNPENRPTTKQILLDLEEIFEILDVESHKPSIITTNNQYKLIDICPLLAVSTSKYFFPLKYLIFLSVPFNFWISKYFILVNFQFLIIGLYHNVNLQIKLQIFLTILNIIIKLFL